MKTKLLIMLGLLLIIGLSCEPTGGGYGYQYLGRVRSIQFRCDAMGGYTTVIRVCSTIFVVRGKVDIPGKQNAFVWANASNNTLLLRGLNSISAEHTIISAKKR